MPAECILNPHNNPQIRQKCFHQDSNHTCLHFEITFKYKLALISLKYLKISGHPKMLPSHNNIAIDSFH